ncbi:MAG: ATP-binding protein [Clostridia bacterium]|nr:ATP-binding protein [Clostridia bacterium]
MVRICYSTDGSCAAYTVAEITKVPYYELIHRIPEKACEMNQVFFTQLLLGIFRASEPENTSFEILFHSIPVTDQTYAAQVRMYFVIRKIGNNSEELVDFINNLSVSIKNDMERQNFSVEFMETEEEYADFFASLKNVDSSSCAAISKKDRIINSMFGGMVYFNDAIITTDNVNITAITNTMTQYPNSVISLQVIPTSYHDVEKASLMQVNSMLEYYIGELRRLHGMMPLDAGTQSLSDAFRYYLSAFNDNNVYYNLMVYSPPTSIDTLCNKLISMIENETIKTSNALETVYIRESRISICDYFEVSPWVNNNYLIYNEREHNFWNSKNAPVHMMRLRYLMTLGEIRTVFKFPIDDGTAIGLDSRKILTNREKLNKNIISEGNFKIGIIQNSSANSIRATHAGIPLNDFTKHGLIVGTPGSGKTNFSLGFLLQMWNEFNIPFIAIEPTKTEYRSLVDGIDGLQVFTPGKSNVSPYIINPFVPPTGVTVETYVPSLMTAFKAAFSMPDPLPDIFLASINECYNEYGWRLNSTKDDVGIEPFGMYEFIRVFKRRIQSMDYKGDVKANMESAGVVRLVSLIEQNSLIYDNIHTIPVEDLLSKPTVIELNAINNKEQKSLIMALLLILICIYTKNNVAGDGKLKNILLIDEAHVLLGGSGHVQDGSPDSQGATIEAVEDMIAEIRSYGTGIIIADQAPTKVGKNIVANTNVKVMFRLVEKDNKDMIRNATNMTDADYDRLGRLGVGEAMLHYGRVHEPLHIKTYNVLDKADIRPFIFDKDIAVVSHYWEDKQYLLIPHNECKYNCECTDKCDFKVRADADFIASRLVNRFRPSINTLSELASLLPKLDMFIRESAEDMASVQLTLKLFNCTKIKFLRKMLLAKSIDISKVNYRRILEHERFLKKQ